jgi:hypothetical protein
LPLGDGSLFVHSQLRRLRQEDNAWEADFLAMPSWTSEPQDLWIGMVISHTHDHLLARHTTEAPPTADDLANLLALAMRRPLIDDSHRPRFLHLRARPEWNTLVPRLKLIGIEVCVQKSLPKWDEAFWGLRRLAQDLLPRRRIPASTSPAIRKAFPALAKWDRRCGKIELEHQEGASFVAKAYFHGGLIFEDDQARNLLEAMAALEQGIATWMKKEGVDLVGSAPAEVPDDVRGTKKPRRTPSGRAIVPER